MMPKKKIYSEQLRLLFKNLKKLILCRVNFYITFTGEPILRDQIRRCFGDKVLEDHFVIDIKPYKALENTL